MRLPEPASLTGESAAWRILLVDDQANDHPLLQQMLSQSRLRKVSLDWVASYAQGRDGLKTDPGYDTVIVKYDLGHPDWLEIIRALVALNYPAPVLVLCGKETYDADVEALKAGAADYLCRELINPLTLERTIGHAIERKQNEISLRAGQAQLRESETRYQDLFNSMINGFALHEIICDEQDSPVDYRFLEVNPAFEQLTGLQGSDIIGKTVREILPGIEMQWIERYAKVALTGEPVNFESYTAPLDRYYQVYAFSPKKYQFATFFMEITDRVKAERSLRESENRFRAIFNNLHSVMLLIDPQSGRIMDANPAACSFYGYSLEQLRQTKISDINTLPLNQTQQKISEAEGTPTSKMFNFQHRLANGEIRDVDVHSGPIQINDQKVLFSIIYDITEHRKIEKALHESEARYRTFFDHMQETVPCLQQCAMRRVRWSIGSF